MTIRMKAVKNLSYGGKRYLAGQRFEASHKHSRVLVAAKAAKLDDEVKEVPKKVNAAKPAQTSPKNEPKKVEAEKIGAMQTSGQYGRRDLTPEGSKK